MHMAVMLCVQSASHGRDTNTSDVISRSEIIIGAHFSYSRDDSQFLSFQTL